MSQISPDTNTVHAFHEHRDMLAILCCFYYSLSCCEFNEQ